MQLKSGIGQDAGDTEVTERRADAAGCHAHGRISADDETGDQDIASRYQLVIELRY